MKSTIQNLKAARKLLADHGVGRNEVYDEDTGKYCSMGAVAAAKFDLTGEQMRQFTHGTPQDPYGNESDTWPEFITLNEQLPVRHCKHLGTNIFRFNDDAMRPGGDGQEVVLALFDRAIESLESAAGGNV